MVVWICAEVPKVLLGQESELCGRLQGLLDFAKARLNRPLHLFFGGDKQTRQTQTDWDWDLDSDSDSFAGSGVQKGHVTQTHESACTT